MSLSLSDDELNLSSQSSISTASQRTTRRGQQAADNQLVDMREYNEAKDIARNMQKKYNDARSRIAELLKENQSFKQQQQKHSDSDNRNHGGENNEMHDDDTGDHHHQQQRHYDSDIHDYTDTINNIDINGNDNQMSDTHTRKHSSSKRKKHDDSSSSSQLTTNERKSKRKRRHSRNRRHRSDTESSNSSVDDSGDDSDSDSDSESDSESDDDRRDRRGRKRKHKRSRSSSKLSLAQKLKRSVGKMKFVDIVQFSEDAHKHTKTSDIPPITRMNQFVDCLVNMLHAYTREHTDHRVTTMVSKYVQAMKRICDRHRNDKNVSHMIALDRRIRQEMNGHKGQRSNWRINSDDDDIQHLLNIIKDESTSCVSTATYSNGSEHKSHHHVNTTRHVRQRNNNRSGSGNSSTQICYKYNGENGKNNFGAVVMCKHSNCKYKHTCIICKADHSRCDNAACKDADTTPHHRA
jgi:hypothetical protein